MPVIALPGSRGGEGRGRFKILPIILFLFFGVYYYFSHQEVVPITGRTQVVGLSPQEEAALGLQSYNAILDQSRVISSGPEVERIKSIGRRIAAVTEGKGFDWEFNVIDSDEVNAFCLPGGKVAVYTGLLPVAQNDDGLAIVIGHEIAHAIARHGAERIAHQQLAQLGQVSLGMAVGDMDRETQRMVIGAFGAGAQFGVLLPFSRKHESEADYIGLQYVARACFDPQEAPRLWERMARNRSQGTPPEWLSTHPAERTRIEQFREWMPEALTVRSKYCPGK